MIIGKAENYTTKNRKNIVYFRKDILKLLS